MPYRLTNDGVMSIGEIRLPDCPTNSPHQINPQPSNCFFGIQVLTVFVNAIYDWEL